MIKSIKCQFSSIEIILLILLFASVSSYLYKPIDSSSQDYKFNIDSGLDAIYYSDDYRDIIMNENLSVLHTTQDWSSLNSTISNMYPNFELIISDNANTKILFHCNETLTYYTKYYTERVFAIENNDNFGFRKLRLGVCY